MFRAPPNVFDEAVAKATDENLTSENWEYILDVCDRANSNDAGPKDVVASLIKRLAHRNANVQLYTLELANALSQNCGQSVHRELSSRSFTDALLRLANDRNTHQQVKAKILERMAEWSRMFARDPDLGIMDQAYTKLKSQNPNLQPPSAPEKRQITDADREKEEQELQMALELSIKVDKAPAPKKSIVPQGSTQAAAPLSYENHPPPASSGTTAATVSRVRALFDFQPSEPGELQFKKGDIIAVLESVYKDWWKGSLRGQTGIFPLNYVEKLTDPTHEEMQREAQMEAEVFAEIKNVEKLLTLLSTSTTELNARDNDEITTLYHQTLAVRPKLIELIGKYSQRKDDFTQLNEKFIKARRDYEALLEASMSQPPPPSNLGRPTPGYGFNTAGYVPHGTPAPHELPSQYSANFQDGRVSQSYNSPPQATPIPFHIAAQTHPHILKQQQQQQQQRQQQQQPQQAQQLQQTAYPQDLHVGPPSSGRPPTSSDAYNMRPHSTYDHPQELGTPFYATPTDSRPQSYPPQFQAHVQAPTEYSPSVYSPEESTQQPSSFSSSVPQPALPSQHPPSFPPSQPPQHAFPPSQQQPQQPQQPAYPPSQPYGAPHPAQPTQPPPKAPSPTLPSPYPTSNPAPPTGTYQAYQPPRTTQTPQHGYAANGGSNPQDFYR